MKVYVVTGYNGLLDATGCAGVSTTQEGAERIQQEQEYMLDDSIITEHDLK